MHLGVPDFFPTLGQSEQSILPETCTQMIGTTDSVSRQVFVFLYFDYGNNDNCGSCNVTFKTLKTGKKILCIRYRFCENRLT